MPPTVYIETTIVSYLTARPSRDLLRVAQQQSTLVWWEEQRPYFKLLTSDLVQLEASAGDASAAAARIGVLAGLDLLQVDGAASIVADALVHAGAFPAIAARDALHVGICAANGVEYLLTWNFKHLANAVLRDRIVAVCEDCGFAAPVICTPDELEYES